MEVRYEDPMEVAALALERWDLGRRIEAVGGWMDLERERMFARPVAALAAWHLTLPAARDHHAEAGGAIRLALEAGWAALRLAEGAVFAANEPSERRRRLEPQYRWAAWLAAIASTLHLPASRLAVTSGKERWDAHLGPLAPWLDARGRCEISWRQPPLEVDRCLAAFCARWVLPDPMPLEAEVARACIAAIAPGPAQEGSLARIVREALSRVEEADRRRNASRWVPEPAAQGSAAKALEAEMDAEARAGRRPEEAGSQPADGAPVAATERAETHAAPALQNAGDRGKASSRPDAPAPMEPACADLLRLLAGMTKDPAAARKLAWERDGLSVPLSLLAEAGLSSEAALALLRRSRLLVKRDGRRCVIAPAAGEQVLPRKAEAVHA